MTQVKPSPRLNPHAIPMAHGDVGVDGHWPASRDWGSRGLGGGARRSVPSYGNGEVTVLPWSPSRGHCDGTQGGCRMKARSQEVKHLGTHVTFLGHRGPPFPARLAPGGRVPPAFFQLLSMMPTRNHMFRFELQRLLLNKPGRPFAAKESLTPPPLSRHVCHRGPFSIQSYARERRHEQVQLEAANDQLMNAQTQRQTAPERTE